MVRRPFLPTRSGALSTSALPTSAFSAGLLSSGLLSTGLVSISITPGPSSLLLLTPRRMGRRLVAQFDGHRCLTFARALGPQDDLGDRVKHIFGDNFADFAARP